MMKHFGMIALFASVLSYSSPVAAREAMQFKTPPHDFKVEFFTNKNETGRPAVIILSGSRGFASSAYDEIGSRFVAAGLDVYLPHLLSPQDLQHIATAKNAQARIAHCNQRRTSWIGSLRTLVSELNGRGYNRRLGIMGISLGAETVSIAVLQGLSVDAVVLVDGVSSTKQQFSAPKLPPFHLIWGSADTVFPLSAGMRFVEQINQSGGAATLTVTNGASHDFFLEAGTAQAKAAHEDAIKFFLRALKTE